MFLDLLQGQAVAKSLPKKGHEQQVCQTRTALWNSSNRKTVCQRKKEFNHTSDISQKYSAAAAAFVPNSLLHAGYIYHLTTALKIVRDVAEAARSAGLVP